MKDLFEQMQAVVARFDDRLSKLEAAVNRLDQRLDAVAQRLDTIRAPVFEEDILIIEEEPPVKSNPVGTNSDPVKGLPTVEELFAGLDSIIR